jgi:hypothetical protein
MSKWTPENILNLLREYEQAYLPENVLNFIARVGASLPTRKKYLSFYFAQVRARLPARNMYPFTLHEHE